MKISAGIVIYNENKETLQKAINSFVALDYPKELIVVDNSPVNTLEPFCQSFDGVRYIFTGKNLGFGAGHNLAFKKSSKDSSIHMIINPDVYFDSNDIDSFLQWFDKEKNISLAIPLVLNPDGSRQNVVRNIPTPLSLIKRKLGIDFDEIDVHMDEISEIPFAHGCFFASKTDIFEKLGGFDERFFMYMEDIDIYIRAKQYGKTMINTQYKIYHKHRKGSSRNFKLFCYHFISAIKFFWKHR